MAKSYNLTLQLNLQGPSNLRAVTANIKRELGSIANAGALNISIDNKSLKSLDSATQKLRTMTAALQQAQRGASALNSTLATTASSFKNIQTATAAAAQNLQNVSRQSAAAATGINNIGTSANKTSGYLRRLTEYTGFQALTVGLGKVAGALNNSLRDFVQYERNLNRIQQITGVSVGTLSNLNTTIRKLSTSFGTTSKDLSELAVTFTQAGFAARDVENSLRAVAQASLAPTFTNIADAAQGAIAVIGQFGIQTSQLERVFDSFNEVSSRFAIEFDDLVEAVRRGGGAFASSNKGLVDSQESLNQYISLITTARATTRESVETISTGIRTIGARLQQLSRQKSIEDILGIQLSENGQFVGVYKAIELISNRVRELGLSTRDVRFAQLVEEIGGIRQISRVIPLLENFTTAQEALGVAQGASGSTARAAELAQQTLAVQLSNTKQAFDDLVASFANNGSLKGLASLTLTLTKGFLTFAKAFAPFAPILAALAGIQIAKGVSKVFGGGISGLFGGGNSQAQQQATQATQALTQASGTNTQALNNLTTAVQNFTPTQGINSGGYVQKFARGGVVPGSGNRDTVPAMLTPGEFVIRKDAVSAIGADKLHQVNKYAEGGVVSQRRVGAITLEPGSSEAFITNEQILNNATADNQKTLSGILNNRTESTGSAGFFLLRRGLEEQLSKQVDEAIRIQTAAAIDGISKQLQDSPIGALSPSIANSSAENMRSFFNSVNAGLRGSLFEALLNNIITQGNYSSGILNSNPDAPFDIENGIGRLVEIPGLGDLKDVNYADIKASVSAASTGNIAKKIGNELLAGPSTVQQLQEGTLQERLIDAIRGQVSSSQLSSIFNIPGRQGDGKDLDLGLSDDQTQIAKEIDRLIKSGVFYQSTKAGKPRTGTFTLGLPQEKNRLSEDQLQNIQEFATGGLVQKFMAGGYSKPVSPKQLAFLQSLVEKNGVPEGFEYPPKTSAQASALIDRIKNPPKQGLDLNSLFKEYQQIFGIPHPQVNEIEDSNEEDLRNLTQSLDRTIEKYNKFANVIKEYYGKIIQQDSYNGSFYALGGPNPRMPKRAELDRFVNGGFDRKLLEEFGQRGDLAFGSTVNAPRGRSANSSALRTRKTYMRGYAEGGLVDILGDTGSALFSALYSAGSGVIGGFEGGLKQSFKAAKDSNLLGAIQGVGSELRKGLFPTIEEINQFDKTGKNNSDILGATLKASGSLAKTLGSGVLGAGFGALDSFAKAGVESGLLGKTAKAGKSIGKGIFNFGKAGISSLFQKKATGGSIEDSVPALLTPGEFVINKKAAGRIGAATLNKMNHADKSVKGFNKGGPVGFVQRFAEGGEAVTFSTQESAIVSAIEQVAERIGESTGETAAIIQDAIIEGYVRLQGSGGQDEQTAKRDALADFYTGITDLLGESEDLEEAFKNLSGSIVEGEDKFDALRSALEKITSGASTAAQTTNIGNVVSSGRTQAIINGGGGGGTLSRLFPTFSKGLGAASSAVKGFATKFATDAKFMRKTIVLLSGAIGTAAGVIQNQIGDLTDPTNAGVLGGIQGGAAGAATGTAIAGQLGLGPVGTAITAAGFAVVGALKGFSDAFQKTRLNNLLIDLGEATAKVAKGFELLEANQKGATDQIVAGFGQQIELGKSLENLSRAGTFAERTLERFAPVLDGILGTKFTGSTGIDRNRLGGINAAATAFGATEAVDPTAGLGLTGLGGLVGFGAAGGVGVLGAGLDILADYIFTNSEAVLRARDAYAALNKEQFETAAKFAEQKGTRAAEGEVEDASSITNLYYESLKRNAEAQLRRGQQLSAEDERRLKQEANDQAAIAAAYKQAQEAGGGAVDALNKLSREEQILQGLPLLAQEQKLVNARIAQARATRDVTVATEAQIDIYRRFSANLTRASNELNRSYELLNEFISFDQGATVDRSNEQVLGNLLAYSPEEVRAASAPIVGALGGTDQAVRLQENLQTTKFLEERLPAALRNAEGDPEAAREVVNQLTQELEAAGLDSQAGRDIINQINERIEQQGTGALVEDIDFGGIITQYSKAAQEGAKVLEQATRTYNDALQRSVDLQRKYNESLNRANDYLAKAAQVQANATLQLNEVIGRESTLEQRQAPFNIQIDNLTSGLVDQGVLAQGDRDPTAIREGISSLRQRNTDLETRNQQIRDVQGTLGTGAADQALQEQLNNEYRANLSEIQNNTNALSRGRDALEQLANSTDLANAALKQYEQEQRKAEGAANFLQRTLTNSFEDNFKAAGEIAVSRAALSGDQSVLQTRVGRQAAFSGLDQFKELLSSEDYNKQRAQLIRQSVIATQGEAGLDLEAGSTGKTYRELLDRLENPEESPELQEYKRAAAVQEAANIELANLEKENTAKIGSELEKLNQFFETGFAATLADALRQAQEAAQEPQAPEVTAEQQAALDDVRQRVAAAEQEAEAKAREAGLAAERSDIAGAEAEAARRTGFFGEGALYQESGENLAGVEGAAERESTVFLPAAESAASTARGALRYIGIDAGETIGERQERTEFNALAARQARTRADEEADAAEQRVAELKAEEAALLQNISEQQQTDQRIQQLDREAAGRTQARALLNTPLPAPGANAQSQAASAGAAIAAVTQGNVPTQSQAPSAGAPIANAGSYTSAQLTALQQQRSNALAAQQQTSQANSGQSSSIATTAAQAPAPPSAGSIVAGYRQRLANGGQLNPFQARQFELAKREQRRQRNLAAQDGGSISAEEQVVQAEASRRTEQQAAQQGTSPAASMEQAVANFGSYVEKLINFEFPTIPETINIEANHNVVVTFQGAAALEGLSSSLQTLAVNEVNIAIEKIRRATNGQINVAPNTAGGGAASSVG